MSSEFTYQNFLAHIKKAGVVKQNRFDIIVSPPPALAAKGYDVREVSMLAKAANIPGVNVATSNLTVVGEPITMAYGKTYGEATITFYTDKKFKARTLFEDWVDAIQDPDSRLLGWYNDTISNVIVSILDKDDSNLFNISLFEAKPKSVGNLSVDQSANDLLLFDVVFDFKYYRTEAVGVSEDLKGTDNRYLLTDFSGGRPRLSVKP
jgi:hypothetical protein